ncbi:LPS translocon maturation chaperone LptM [Spiribacter insolitus]|uniref:Lipoprotein n=1 Tax=Spiribacter insolitus TaxID=3122417 RepID=A0ABV3TB05_9GAMM
MRILPCLLLVLLILLTGCGVKGDLYLPETDSSAASEETA